MNKFLTKNKNYLFALVGIVVVYFLSRLYNIMSLPMFTDEAIYTRWAQIAKNDSEWLFISLTDGKQPLFVWVDMLFMYLVTDPLLAGRLASVLAGFVTIFGIYFLTREVFQSKKAGVVAAALYVLYPFALVYDRMALYDSMVTMFFTWGLYLTVVMVRKLSIKSALALGLIAGLGALNKTSGFLTVYLLPFSLLIFDFSKKGRYQRILRWVGLSLIATLITYVMYNFLRVSPFFYIIAQKNDTFIYPVSEWIKSPFTYFLSNFSSISSWTITYMTIPILLLAVSSLFVTRKFTREKIYLITLFAVLIAVPIVFGRILFPRYIFFMTIPLLVVSSFAWVEWCKKIKNIFIQIVITILLLAFWLRADFLILTNFASAPLPKSDTDQYMNVWPAGGGYSEIVEFFAQKAKTEKIFVATEGTFGSLPTYTIEIYLGENKNIEKKGFYPITDEIPQELVDKAKEMPVYFVFNETQNIPQTWPIEFINEYQKGNGNYYMRVYKVIPENETE